MLLTIAIPTFNRPEFLEESLRSAINQQTNLDYEILICDNCSNEQNLNRIKCFIKNYKFKNLKLLESVENIGMYNNWNRCIENAAGEYITILNDDDLLDEYYVEKMRVLIQGNQLIACRSENFGDLRWVELEKNNFLSKLGKCFLRQKKIISKVGFSEMFKGNPVSGSLGVIFNKSAALKIGGFDVKMRMSADYDFYVRYCEQNEFYIINNVLAFYRYHQNETFKPGVLESFVDDTYLIRKKYCESVLPQMIKPYYMLAIDLHREVQIKRYKKIFPNIFTGITLEKKMSGVVNAFADRVSLDVLRLVLFLTVLPLSILAQKKRAHYFG